MRRLRCTGCKGEPPEQDGFWRVVCGLCGDGWFVVEVEK